VIFIHLLYFLATKKVVEYSRSDRQISFLPSSILSTDPAESNNKTTDKTIDHQHTRQTVVISSMGKKTVFLLKDSPADLIAAATATGKGIPKGRTYSKEYSDKPGAIRIDDLVMGMKYASLAITDDKRKTLKKVGKTNPWHIEALTVITGSVEEAHKPLTTILHDHMNLTCDHIIDISGFSKAGHALDTQGFIAHNDEVIVLSYRCTTSINDWLTNLTTTSSEWEPEIDIPQGHSGYISAFAGLCCLETYKPRVHTGFYNNFLVSAPDIQQYIEPLLAPDQPPRKLFVVGHSLGAGIATMAACYFLTKYNWAELPHKLINVTAGCPRACQTSMKLVVEAELRKLRPLDKAVFCRIVRDRDVVPTLPPAMFGFAHLDKMVFITDEGEILINPVLADEHVIDPKEMKFLMKNTALLIAPTKDEDDASSNMEEPGTKIEVLESSYNTDKQDESSEKKSNYEKTVAMIPRRFRDHMPDFYLKPLIALFELHNPTPEVPVPVAETAASAIVLVETVPEKQEERKRKGLFGRSWGKKKSTKTGAA
jgi:Lipase (class 3)